MFSHSTVIGFQFSIKGVHLRTVFVTTSIFTYNNILEILKNLVLGTQRPIKLMFKKLLKTETQAEGSPVV